MLRRLLTLVVLFLAAASTWAADGPKPAPKQQATASQNTATTAKPKTSRPTKKKPSAKKPPEPENVFTAPPPPPTLAQQPAIAPEVMYRGGELTITARNSTMNDVLTAVRRVTGATIERPPASGNDRVVGVFGPGQPKDVLSDLLNGSPYDYIILGSMSRPGAIERVVLTQRSNSAPATAVAANNPGQPNNPTPDMNQEQETEPEADVEDETAPEREQEPAQDTAPGENPPPPQPGNVQQQPPDQQNPQQQQQNQPQVKSPEELLRELQQMQQQQQQQQQRPPDNPPPQ